MNQNRCQYCDIKISIKSQACKNCMMKKSLTNNTLNNNDTFILIIGGKRSGKSTIANMISKELKLTTFNLSDSLKELVCELNGIPLPQLEELKLDETKLVHDTGSNMRQLLQSTADFLKKAYGENVFCKELDSRTMLIDQNVYIVGDIRYQHEYNYFNKKYTTFSIKIVNTKSTVVDSHSSENKWGNIDTDCTIINNMDGLDKLHTKNKGNL
ncbi:hypothetical protein OAF54_03120 [bacterium]|nr:hypothetical protein [bacterium]